MLRVLQEIPSTFTPPGRSTRHERDMICKEYTQRFPWQRHAMFSVALGPFGRHYPDCAFEINLLEGCSARFPASSSSEDRKDERLCRNSPPLRQLPEELWQFSIRHRLVMLYAAYLAPFGQ